MVDGDGSSYDDGLTNDFGDIYVNRVAGVAVDAEGRVVVVGAGFSLLPVLISGSEMTIYRFMNSATYGPSTSEFVIVRLNG